MNYVKFSILMPCYSPNIELFEQCLKSINVSFAGISDYEIVVGVQGDTDISELSKKFNIRVVRFSKPSLYCTRVNLLRHATGNYAWFIDVDDLVFPESGRLLYNLIVSTGYLDVYSFDYFKFSSENQLKERDIDSNSPKNIRIVDKNTALKKFYNRDGVKHNVCVNCFRLSLFTQFPDIDVFMGEDAVFSDAIFNSARTFCLTNAKIYGYRWGKNSGSYGFKISYLFDLMVDIKTISINSPSINPPFLDYLAYNFIIMLRRGLMQKAILIEDVDLIKGRDGFQILNSRITNKEFARNLPFLKRAANVYLYKLAITKRLKFARFLCKILNISSFLKNNILTHNFN